MMLPMLVMLAATSCAGGGSVSRSPGASGSPAMLAGRADVGGYELSYQCMGSGGPTVILEAGYGTGGTGAFMDIQPDIAAATHTRTCTYDRAGTSTSDPRPASDEPVTGERYAAELQALMDSIGVGPPYVLVGHSFGGMIVRSFAAVHPDEVVGIVLIDASSEPEIAVYRRFHAGAWVDHTSPVAIDAMVSQLRAAPSLGSMPLLVITADELEDRWLRKVPDKEAAFQARLRRLSDNATQVIAGGSGHFVQDEDPALVLEAIREVVVAARDHTALPACAEGMAAALDTAVCP